MTSRDGISQNTLCADLHFHRYCQGLFVTFLVILKHIIFQPIKKQIE